MSSLISKGQIAFDRKEKIPKPPPEKLCIELKVPREKIQHELNILKQEMLQEVQEIKNNLEIERIQFSQKKQLYESEKIAANQDLSTQKQKVINESSKLGYQEGLEQGNKKGYAEGYQKGSSEFDLIKEEYIKNTKEIFNKINELNEYKKDIFKSTEPYFIGLVDSILKKVIADEFVANPPHIMDVIRDALRKMGEMERIRIKVNPQHYDFITENKQRLIAQIGSVQSLDILKSETIQPGGCIIETEYGLVDATIETKMIGIMEVINKTFETKQLANTALIERTLVQEKTATQDEDDIFEQSDELLTLSEDELDGNDLSFFEDEEEDLELEQINFDVDDQDLSSLELDEPDILDEQ